MNPGVVELPTEMAEPSLEIAAPAGRPDFAEIVRDHQAMVFSIAFHFVHDRSLAEELAQEVFLRLYTNLDAMKSPEHIKFWLRKVTSRRCIDYSRRRGGNVEVNLEQVPELAAEAPAGDPMLAGKLRKLVASLPEKPRIVVVLRYQEDLEPGEIAKILGMPVRTVKSHLRRALAVLRDKAARSLGEVRL